MATTAASGHTMYTVHRVVTTAQIQTAIGNTYTSSSSVSSVVSALRNEEENITSPMAASLPTVNGNCALNLNSCPAAPGRRLTNMEDNSIANNILQSGTAAKDSRQSPVIGTGIHFLSQNTQKISCVSENNHSTSRLQNVTCGTSNGFKPSTVIPRPLQN
ncbi:PREDICTED: uncharacterized protein LOC108365921 [Rhagoletis zephyria]|uniref:uncharacterized protein LOC108365921 n=1 Tax=Rhagoletis zephyria TaxID=28612 RepID=UPI000811685C|nr:PREDICTED: uncharacterized protein LOC108365921 [Rhagoletis zephyria]